MSHEYQIRLRRFVHTQIRILYQLFLDHTIVR